MYYIYIYIYLFIYTHSFVILQAYTSRVNPSFLHSRTLTDNTVPFKLSLNKSVCHSRQHNS